MDHSERRRLSFAWLGALLLLGALAGASCWIAIVAVHSSADTEALLDAARLRMLCQRAALLAHRYAASNDDLAKLDLRWEQRLITEEMRQVVDKHASPARSVAGQPPLSAPVFAIYSQPPYSVSSTVARLRDEVRKLVDDETLTSRQKVDHIESIDQTSTDALKGLDELVEQLRQEHEARVSRLATLHLQLFASALAALVAIGALLVWPTLRDRDPRRRAGAGSTLPAPNHPAAGTPPPPRVGSA